MSEENLSEVLAVRREKLKKLQEEGKNPFEMTRYDVTAYADDVNENFEAYEEKPVSMAGRIMSRICWKTMMKSKPMTSAILSV